MTITSADSSFLTTLDDDVLDFGSKISTYITNFNLGKILTYGNYQILKPNYILKNNNNLPIFENMPLYSGENEIPTGKRNVNVGKIGEIRWDEKNIYLKTNNLWRVVPTMERTNYERDCKYSYSGVLSVPSKSIGAWGSVDISLSVQGLLPESGIVLNLTPSKWLEGGLQFSSWISAKDTITLRITNVTGDTITTSTQNWFYKTFTIDN